MNGWIYQIPTVLLYNRIKAIFEHFHQKWKNASCGVQFRNLQIKYVTSLCTFEDIALRESHGKLHKKTSETLGAG